MTTYQLGFGMHASALFQVKAAQPCKQASNFVRKLQHQQEHQASCERDKRGVQAGRQADTHLISAFFLAPRLYTCSSCRATSGDSGVMDLSEASLSRKVMTCSLDQPWMSAGEQTAGALPVGCGQGGRGKGETSRVFRTGVC